MRALPALLLVPLALLSLPRAARPAAPQDYDTLKAAAEERYAEGSFALSRELYEEASGLELDQEQKRWVEFRLADTGWRDAAASDNPDSSRIDAAKKVLDELAREPDRPEQRDLVWALTHESLGDMAWDRQASAQWYGGWPHYQKALDWWAGSSDLDVARERYLGMVFRMARPGWYRSSWDYGYHGNWIEEGVLANAAEIAQEAEDIAQVRFLQALTWSRADWSRRAKVVEAYEEVLSLGRETPWYDDALYRLGVFWEETGHVELDEQGRWTSTPDYVKAVEVLRRLSAELLKGETRFWNDAKSRVRRIVSPSLAVTTSNAFLPGSKLRVHLRWRNVESIDLSFYRFDLSSDVDFSGSDDGSSNWLQHVDVRDLDRQWRVEHETGDDGRHVPGSEDVVLGHELPLGAYVVVGRADGEESRDLLLVTDSSLLTKSYGDDLIAWFCDAVTGEPIAGAEVLLWERYHDSRDWRWRRRTARTGEDGTSLFELAQDGNHQDVFVGVRAGDRQAFATGNTPWRSGPPEGWRIYASTDRPAYRPDDTVQFKFTARTYDEGVYSTPAGREVAWAINDPRGAKVADGKAKLNSFGSAWSSLETTATMPLGSYTILFDEGGRRVGSAELFRLEEYKLPEFEVTVRGPRDDEGRPRSQRVGEPVTVEVEASYYFGGPVADATVELLVYQRPYWHHWAPPRRFPWYWNQDDSYSWMWWGNGDLVVQKTLTTDAAGRASLTFETPGDRFEDFEYTVEARVTDASRREVQATGRVRVTRQAYYVHPSVKHRVLRPGGRAEVELRALDANEQPVEAQGTVRVTRERWEEIWQDPSGRRVKGEDLTAARARHEIFPPPSLTGEARWELVFRGYTLEEVAEHTVRTDEEGEGRVEFAVVKEGFYRATWTSEDAFGAQVRADATVWVCDERTRHTGYRGGGLEIVVDDRGFRAGEDAAVMFTAPESGRWVLFTVAAEELYEYRVVHMEGTAKLITLPLTEQHVPNVYLGAASMRDREVQVDTVEIVVPPVDKFLDVEVALDRESYEPGEAGQLRVTARDENGRPVRAELSLTLFDEAVAAIQSEIAGDPRSFFYGQKRALREYLATTHGWKPYIRLVEDEEGRFRDDRQVRLEAQERAQYGWDMDDAGSLRALGYVGGASGPAPVGASREARGRSSGKRAEMNGLMSDSADAFFAAPMEEAGGAANLGEPVPEDAVVVRSDFRATALWVPDLVTDEDGTATAQVEFPDSLTRWSAVARVADEGNRFGWGHGGARTRMPLTARLQAPRFFVVGDQVVISSLIDNNTEQDLFVAAGLEASGIDVLGLSMDNAGRLDLSRLLVPANGQMRLDWLADVTEPGSAALKVTARGTEHSDGMERSLPVYPHGIEAFEAAAGKVRGDEAVLVLDVPGARKDGSTVMSVQVAPSLAVTMLDALPYLVRYPYGCTEQTMSRFLPAVVVARTLRDQGLDPEVAMARVFGGIEREFVGETHQGETPALDHLDEVVEQSLARLYDFQHSDGGWAWWKHGDSDRFMTAYVVWGLALAHESGVDVNRDVLARGAKFLDENLVEEEERPDMQAFLLHALATYLSRVDYVRHEFFVDAAFENLWKKRSELNAYTRALFAIAAYELDRDEQAQVLVDNLVNGVIRDEAPELSDVQRGDERAQPDGVGTAHWGEDGIWWRWSNGGVEATATALRALLAIRPDHELVEPVTNWLLKNRRGAQWSNTRDTAMVVLAMNDFLRTSGELGRSVAYEVEVNGSVVATREVSPDEILAAPSVFPVDAELVRSGENTVRIRRTGGEGPLYVAAQCEFFSTEEPVTPRGNEIFVRREYFRLAGRPTLLKGTVYDRVRVEDGDVLESGDRVEVVITVEAKNHYEYLVFEDLKPAGLEAVQLRSGDPVYAKQLKRSEVEHRFGGEDEVSGTAVASRGLSGVRNVGYTGRTRRVHQELRDRKVAIFVDQMPEGVWEVRYDLRAEVPGSFHALPVMGHAMYVPEIRCNGAEIRVTVTE